MLYHIINIGDKDYKCVLTMRALVEAEKRMGENPLNMLMSLSGSELPSFEKLMILFHVSLQKYQHSISMDDVYDIYDAYAEDGKTLVDFMMEIVNIFKASGLIKEPKKGKVNNEKN